VSVVKWIGLGGIVPLLKNRSFPGEISRMGAEAFIAIALREIRKTFPKSRVHAFGAGGTRTFPAVFAFGADSADSIGWRQAAGYWVNFSSAFRAREQFGGTRRQAPRAKC
jgi:hypothetical protein